MSKKMGNMTSVAKRLGISRQAVSKLVRNRDRTGAPAPDDAGKFDVEAFAAWYAEDFKPTSGPRRGIRAS